MQSEPFSGLQCRVFWLRSREKVIFAVSEATVPACEILGEGSLFGNVPASKGGELTDRQRDGLLGPALEKEGDNAKLPTEVPGTENDVPLVQGSVSEHGQDQSSMHTLWEEGLPDKASAKRAVVDPELAEQGASLRLHSPSLGSLLRSGRHTIAWYCW